SFGFGGTNAHVILAAAPAPAGPEPEPARSVTDTPAVLPGGPTATPPTLVKLSAADADALVWCAADLASGLADADGPALADVAWTLNTARADLPCRTVLAVRSVPELIGRLTDESGLRAGAHQVTPMNRPSLRLHVPDVVGAAAADMVARGHGWLAVGLEPSRVTGEGRGVVAAAVLAGLIELPTPSDGEGTAVELALARLSPVDRAELTDGRDSPVGELRLDLTEDTPSAAARAWRQGYRIDWSAVTPPPVGSALRLPGYPFSRTGSALAYPRAAAAPAPVVPDRGPADLAGRTTAGATPGEPGLDPVIVDLSGGDVVARCVIDPDRIPLLAEHLVLDRCVVPGVVLLELLLRAGEEAFRRAGQSEALTVTDIVIRRPLVAGPESPIEMQAEVGRPVNGRSTARIAVRTGETWRTHLEAVCLPRDLRPGPSGPAGEPGALTAEHLAGAGRQGARTALPPGALERSGEAVYDDLWHPSFALGASFRLVEWIATWERHGRAVLVPPAPECAGRRSGVRPELLLLDAAVQLVGMAAGATGVAWRERPVHLGTGYRSLELFTDHVSGTVHAEVTVTEDSPSLVTGDIVLTGPSGEAMARMRGVEFRPVSAAALDRVRRSNRGGPGVPGVARAALARTAPVERPGRLLAGLTAQLAALLGCATDAVDADLALTELADSLLLVELQTRVQDALEHDVPMEMMIDAGTLRGLAGLLVAELDLPDVPDPLDDGYAPESRTPPGVAAGAAPGADEPVGQATPAGTRPPTAPPAGPVPLQAATPTPRQAATPAPRRATTPAPRQGGRRTSFGTRIRLMSVPEMDALAGLPPDYRPDAPGPAGERPKAVLLTGASGFVGAFLLDSLLRHTEETVICLVRAENEDHARARLLANLTGYGLPAPDDPQRVRVVVGDLEQPCFGLSPGAFQELHDRVGDIFHNGAVVKWTYPYRGLAPANVEGTREVIRLAALGASRPVHLTSTVGVFSSGADDRPSVDETADLLTSGPLAVGYAQSKWVAERMLRRAGEAGLPITVHRINSGGDARTGAFNRLDHLSMMLKGCIESGTSPIDAAMPLQPAPVDHIARAMVRLALDPAHHGRTFHHVNPALMSWTELFDHVADFGFPTRRLDFDQWRRSITDRSSGTLALLGLAPFLEDSVDYVRLPPFSCDVTAAAAQSAGLEPCPPLDRNLIHTYLQAFVERGFVPEPARP
ncbi:MAG TPA: thioester reductase domain-containing protein, partial [Kineosporiaceae bacterium]